VTRGIGIIDSVRGKLGETGGLAGNRGRTETSGGLNSQRWYRRFVAVGTLANCDAMTRRRCCCWRAIRMARISCATRRRDSTTIRCPVRDFVAKSDGRSKLPYQNFIPKMT
jgi:hypothetical protein